MPGIQAKSPEDRSPGFRGVWLDTEGSGFPNPGQEGIA